MKLTPLIIFILGFTGGRFICEGQLGIYYEGKLVRGVMRGLGGLFYLSGN